RCEAIWNEDGPAARVRILSSNSLRTIRGSTLLLADGKSSLLPPRPQRSGDLGIKAHFLNVRVRKEECPPSAISNVRFRKEECPPSAMRKEEWPPSAIHLFSTGRSYLGVAPIEGGRWNVAF